MNTSAMLRCVWAVAGVMDVSWKMCTFPSSIDRFVSAQIQSHGVWESSMVKVMLKALRSHPNSTLLDVGANIGFYSLAAAADGHRVHSFEPVSLNAAMLHSSINENGFSEVTLHTVAVGDESSELNMGRDATNQGGLRHVRSGKSSVRLPVLPLDQVLSPIRAPLYIKMDIEGGECSAVRGMKRLIEESNIIGFNLEFRNSHDCCEEWMAPQGLFHSLYKKHRLCPRGIAFETVCRSRALDLVWTPC